MIWTNQVFTCVWLLIIEMNDSSCGSTYCLYCVESHTKCNPCQNGENFQQIERVHGYERKQLQASLPVIRFNFFFPGLTLLLRNLILCYIWTSLYNGRPLGHIKRINVISVLMMMMMMLMLLVAVIDSVTYVWALYMGCVSTHGAERHIWYTWLRLLLLLFSFFSNFDFVDDKKSSTKVMIHTKPALFWG